MMLAITEAQNRNFAAITESQSRSFGDFGRLIQQSMTESSNALQISLAGQSSILQTTLSQALQISQDGLIANQNSLIELQRSAAEQQRISNEQNRSLMTYMSQQQRISPPPSSRQSAVRERSAPKEDVEHLRNFFPANGSQEKGYTNEEQDATETDGDFNGRQLKEAGKVVLNVLDEQGDMEIPDPMEFKDESGRLRPVGSRRFLPFEEREVANYLVGAVSRRTEVFNQRGQGWSVLLGLQDDGVLDMYYCTDTRVFMVSTLRQRETLSIGGPGPSQSQSLN
jgi:hypothetical protein